MNERTKKETKRGRKERGGKGEGRKERQKGRKESKKEEGRRKEKGKNCDCEALHLDLQLDGIPTLTMNGWIDGRKEEGREKSRVFVKP